MKYLAGKLTSVITKNLIRKKKEKKLETSSRKMKKEKGGLRKGKRALNS